MLANLISIFHLDEASGNAVDSKGGNTATETSGTIGSGAGFFGNARVFAVGDTEYFATADNASLTNVNGITAWIKLATKTTTQVIAGKWNSTGNQRSYHLYYSAVTDRFEYGVSSNGAGAGVTTLVGNKFGSPSVDTWYFVAAWRFAGRVWLSINGGPADSAAQSGLFDSTAEFRIGADHGATLFHFDGSIHQVTLWKSFSVDDALDMWNGGAGRLYADFEQTSALPAFTKLGAKQARTADLIAESEQLFFPRLNDNESQRSVLSGLPASDYSVLYSSDHATGDGHIGRTDFDDIEGTWTDSGDFIHVAGDQRETPYPLFDSVLARLNVYVHDQASAGHTYSDQHARLLTTTDLETLTDDTGVMPYGNHTGYGQYMIRSGTFHSYHGMAGGECWLVGHSTSADGETFTYGELWPQNECHAVGVGFIFGGTPFLFQFDGGQWYALGVKELRPRLTNYPANIHAIGAVPIDLTTMRPTGGFITLVAPGTGSDADLYLYNDAAIYKIGSTWYLIYTGRNSSGDQSICVAKSDTGNSPQLRLTWPVDVDGLLAYGDTPTTVVDWDAANDSLPAALTKVWETGTDNSGQSAGNYYELKSGSGSSQIGRIEATSAIVPTDFQAVAFTIEGLTFDVATNTQVTYQIGMVDSLTNIDGPILEFSAVNAGRQNGTLRIYSGNTEQLEADAYVFPFTTSDGANIRDWARTLGVDLTFVIHDEGNRCSILVDGHVQYTRPIVMDSVGYGAGVKPFIRVISLTTFPQVYARFTRMTIKTYQEAAPTTNRRRRVLMARSA